MRPRLGHQGYHIISTTGGALNQSPPETDIEFRARIRRRLESDTRPPIGTSELLSRPFSCEVAGVGGRDVVIHDLIGLMPIHLKRGDDQP